MPPPNPRRSGGPRSAAGKDASKRNAFKTGVAAASWYHPQEEAEYSDLLARLLEQYPQPAPTVRLLIERLAVNWVKLNRLERIDNALHEKARLFAQDVAAQRPDNSPASLLPDTPDGRARASAIMGDAAMPDPERMNNVERYRMTFERRICQLIDQIQRQYQPTSSSPVRSLTKGPTVQADISDVAVIDRPTH